MAMAMIYPEPKRGVHSELKNSTGALGFDRRTCRPTLRHRQPRFRRRPSHLKLVDGMAAVQ
jgi:hypothetical protein